ncbi:MAG: HlyD family type I secretion periplasmic adaptor subunit [Gallionellaceae bacterium]|nr:HlyD family type I secretion periplasmic adaptor subunit [Gallionellaceae bacterium]
MNTAQNRTGGRYARLREAARAYREQSRVRELRRLEQDFLPPLLEIQDSPPSPNKRLVLWSLLMLLVVAMLWSWFGHINVVATTTGRFLPDGRLQVVQPMQMGVVKSILVQPGQEVRAGDILVELDAGPLAASKSSLEQNVDLNEQKRRRLAGQLANRRPDGRAASEVDATQRNLWQAEMDAYHSQQQAAAATVREIEAEIVAGEALLASQGHALAIAEEQTENARALAEIGAIARHDYLQAERDRLAQQGELDSRRERMQTLRARLISARAALARLDAERRLHLLDQMATAQQQGWALMESGAKVSHDLAAQNLHTPVDGIVQAVNVTSLGEVVAPRQEVVTIVPKDVPLVVEVQVANQDAGFVKPGQPVEIKVDAFPFMQYGVLPGRLIWISPDAENDAQRGLYYRARIESERTSLFHNGKEMPMRPGMSVTVDVKTGERRIIDFFLSPLLKNLNESLSIR